MIHLRPARAADEAFLFAVFCDSRAAELAALPQAQREALLRLQYQAQARDYGERFPRCEHFVIEFSGEAVGRLLLNREADELRVVDIAVVSQRRGQGIASAVLKALICEAEDAGISLRLSAWHDAPALSLYHQLGFCVCAESATHLELEWRPAS